MEIGEAMSIVEESADEDASVIFGTTTNPDMAIDEVRITIIATGFEDKNAIPEQAERLSVTTETMKIFSMYRHFSESRWTNALSLPF